jgi:Cys-rich repeat protein
MRRLLSLLMLLAGCGVGPDTRRFVCATDTECAAGFLCRAGICDANDGGTSPR